MVDREQGLERTKFNALDKSIGQESTCLQEFTRYWWGKCEHATCILAADSEDRLTYGTTVLGPSLVSAGSPDFTRNGSQNV